MRTPSHGLAVLFAAALLGVAAMAGLVAFSLAGVAGAVVVAVAAAAAAVLVVRSLRRLAPPSAVRHCTCCDGDHTAPVQVR